MGISTDKVAFNFDDCLWKKSWFKKWKTPTKIGFYGKSYATSCTMCGIFSATRWCNRYLILCKHVLPHRKKPSSGFFGAFRRFPKSVVHGVQRWRHAQTNGRYTRGQASGFCRCSLFFTISPKLFIRFQNFLKCKHEERMLLPAVKFHSYELYKMWVMI